MTAREFLQLSWNIWSKMALAQDKGDGWGGEGEGEGGRDQIIM